MLDDVLRVPRTDAIYNMHGYLTKVPVGVIIPFIAEFSPQGGTVVDMFAGSGMTALAAKIAGRNAVVSDISKLGQHIGRGYMAEVTPERFRTVASEIVRKSKSDIGYLYNTIRQSDGEIVESIRAIWSFVYECGDCKGRINYYEAFKAASWQNAEMVCPNCKSTFIKKGGKVIDEEPVLTVVKEHRQVEQPLSTLDYENLAEADSLDFRSRIPSLKITEDREMFKRSALAKWDLRETSKFFSQRNSAVLFDLWKKINALKDKDMKQKLRFCFTAILPRASKRYQWSVKAPLNAANQNYYIAPVFYEWNVYDLFMRKIEAALKADTLLFSGTEGGEVTQEYVTASADNLKHLENESVDFVFTDPPFGSNIFYSDMNLFQEAWIGETTDNGQEAVIRTTVDKEAKAKSRQFYKDVLKASFTEAFRILKKGGHLSIVFGNSKGDVWAMAQQAFIEAGFSDKPVSINILDKGQRSVKGLNSGSESVATLDLIVTLRKPVKRGNGKKINPNVDELIKATLDDFKDIEGFTASHVYLEVLKNAMYQHVDVTKIDLQNILSLLSDLGFTANSGTGKLTRS